MKSSCLCVLFCSSSSLLGRSLWTNNGERYRVLRVQFKRFNCLSKGTIQQYWTKNREGMPLLPRESALFVALQSSLFQLQCRSLERCTTITCLSLHAVSHDCDRHASLTDNLGAQRPLLPLRAVPTSGVTKGGHRDMSPPQYFKSQFFYNVVNN